MNDEIKDYQRGWNDAANNRPSKRDDETASYWLGVADAAVLIDRSYKAGWRDAVAATREALEKRFGKEQAS